MRAGPHHQPRDHAVQVGASGRGSIAHVRPLLSDNDETAPASDSYTGAAASLIELEGSGSASLLSIRQRCGCSYETAPGISAEETMASHFLSGRRGLGGSRNRIITWQFRS
jgi:hypothetical protein